MVRWFPSFGIYLWSVGVAVVVPLAILGTLLGIPLSPMGLLPRPVVLLVIFAFLYVLLRMIIPDSFDHQMSRWPMETEETARALARAMVARGIRPHVVRDGPWVTFELPPLTILVTPATWGTFVMVGPSTGEHRKRVEQLKTFVDGVLGAATSSRRD